MDNKAPILWPFGLTAALLAPIVVWIVLGLVVVALHGWLGWPDAGSMGPVFLSLFLVSALPIGLVLIEFIASRGGKVDIQGVKVDFGQAARAGPTVQISGNLGVPGAIIGDSGAMNVVDAVSTRVAHAVVTLDLGDGDEWWMSRLFVLCAGAVRKGRPTAVVFVGLEGGISGRFLGWAHPSRLLAEIERLNTGADRQRMYQDYTTTNKMLASNSPPEEITYRDVLEKSREIALQLPALMPFLRPQTIPPRPTELRAANTSVIGNDFTDGVWRYAQHPDYIRLGVDALESILLDQIGILHIEGAPDRLTVGRLKDVFAPCLIQTHVEVSDDMPRQLGQFFMTNEPYVEFTRESRHERLAERQEVLQAMLRGFAAIGDS